MIYDLDRVLANPKACATVIFPATGTVDFSGAQIAPHRPIRALVETDFSLDVQSQYSSVDPGNTSAAQAGFNMVQGAIGGANRVIKNVQQTLQRWDGHSSPQFTVPIIIVKYKDSIDILDIIRTLTSACAGTYDNITLKAPYGYGFNGAIETVGSALYDGLTAAQVALKLKSSTNVSDLYSNISSNVVGTWTLRYSDWFIATDLILLHASATIAKETVRYSNEPLYARINLTFTTAYLPDQRTISAWFRPKITDVGSASGPATGTENNTFNPSNPYV